ncbi:histidine kinase [uncultured Oxalicibacterium sp.]|uniref:PAS domain-containing sensor histidine kinase n=1 Tax=uncultured Oxalicibacterium sp. TaxID=1168540 RepID=UPI0025F1A853|nr:histidine kinase [uncultured Oxalicibacterium sp.]
MVDAASLLVLYANPAALSNLQYDLAYLQKLTLSELSSEIINATYTEQIGKVGTCLSPIAVHLRLRRKDGSDYPFAGQLFRQSTQGGDILLAIGNDISVQDRYDKALLESESRLSAMVSNTPGLVYRCLLDAEENFSFPYLSEGCEALLGISAEALRANPVLFVESILPEDRASYFDSMRQSIATAHSWNWEGRIHIRAWNDIKWINLRAAPLALENDVMQWEGIMTNITASKQEQEEIRRSRAQLAELSAHIDTVKEKERTRISREIHDDLGGNLTAIKMALALLTRRLPAKDKSLKEKADYVDQLVDRSIETVHRIAGDLRPGVLDFGIVAAIDWQAKEFEKQCGLPCHFHSNKKEIDLEQDHATALFRIFQEALTNIAKHAQASKVDVALTHTDQYVRLEIVDNGRGIADLDQQKSKSFGIRGMVERSIALGGSVSVSTAPAGGTIVAINVPLATTI